MLIFRMMTTLVILVNDLCQRLGIRSTYHFTLQDFLVAFNTSIRISFQVCWLGWNFKVGQERSILGAEHEIQPCNQQRGERRRQSFYWSLESKQDQSECFTIFFQPGLALRFTAPKAKHFCGVPTPLYCVINKCRANDTQVKHGTMTSPSIASSG